MGMSVAHSGSDDFLGSRTAAGIAFHCPPLIRAAMLPREPRLQQALPLVDEAEGFTASSRSCAPTVSLGRSGHDRTRRGEFAGLVQPGVLLCKAFSAAIWKVGGQSRLAAQGCLPADLRAALLPPGDCQSIPSLPSKYDSSAQAALDMCRMQRSGQTATFSGQVENYAFELCATSPPDTSQLLKRIKMSITVRETTMRTTSGDEWSSEGTAGSRSCSG